ncbi:hypothetical protein [Streptomyces sp. DH37]|uniref:hypothetical protein n=1 Tax=Streptomyces sp. DH37 TaxID=3040122 RepID=UPI00244262FE|nr:hypothetical protein [Streptomyces sp. DH37]MDG9701650.1 hypothetical protein [Streptomyces sp. DH37]
MAETFGIDPTQGGAVALLAIVFLMVLAGRLVPRSALQDMKEERDLWREAHATSEKARQEEREQTAELLEIAKISGHVLTSLPRPAPAREEVPRAPVDQATDAQG